MGALAAGAPQPPVDSRREAHPSHICAGTGLTPATSAPGLGSPLPHLRRDRASHLHEDCARPAHICTGTGLGPAKSAPGLGLGTATSAPGLRSPRPHLRGTRRGARAVQLALPRCPRCTLPGACRVLHGRLSSPSHRAHGGRAGEQARHSRERRRPKPAECAVRGSEPQSAARRSQTARRGCVREGASTRRWPIRSAGIASPATSPGAERGRPVYCATITSLPARRQSPCAAVGSPAVSRSLRAVVDGVSALMRASPGAEVS